MSPRAGRGLRLHDTERRTRRDTPARPGLERARRFYADKLGLEPVEERPGRLLYRCSADTFALFESTGSSPGTFTLMGFTVEGLDATIAELAARGLAFAEDFGTVAMAGAVMALRSAHAWVLRAVQPRDKAIGVGYSDRGHGRATRCGRSRG